MEKARCYLRLWLAFIRLSVVKMTQYPADTVIMIFSMLIREATGLVGILVLTRISGKIGGWDFYEVGLLFSMCAVIEAIGQAFFDNIWSIDAAVKFGQMDVWLTRPAPPYLQLIGQCMHFEAVLSISVYMGIFIWSINGIGLTLGVREGLILVLYVICGTLINSGIYTIFNCLNFWIVQGEEIAVLIQTCREFVKYPLHVFPKLIRNLFTYVLPFGFVAYYPAMELIDKSDRPIIIIMPLVTAGIVGIASVVWKKGVQGYNSTGT